MCRFCSRSLSLYQASFVREHTACVQVKLTDGDHVSLPTVVVCVSIISATEKGKQVLPDSQHNSLQTHSSQCPAERAQVGTNLQLTDADSVSLLQLLRSQPVFLRTEQLLLQVLDDPQHLLQGGVLPCLTALPWLV